MSEDTTARDRLKEVLDGVIVDNFGTRDNDGTNEEILDALLAHPEDLAEVAGLTTHERAVQAYEEGRQWGERWGQRETAEKIEAYLTQVEERSNRNLSDFPDDLAGDIANANLEHVRMLRLILSRARSFAGGEEET